MEASFGETRGRWLPGDVLVAFYLGLTALLVLWRMEPWSSKLVYLGAHGLGIALIAVLVRGTWSSLPGLRFLREWHPFLFIFPLYSEVGVLNRLLSPRYYDQYLLPIEEFLFGGQPSIYLVESLPYVWLSEALHLIYFLYLLLIPPLMFPLYFRGRVHAFRRCAFLVVGTYLVCFLIFVVFPMESPNFLFDKIGGPLSEYPLFQLVHGGMQQSVTKGAAFPSSHVAAATAIAYCAHLYLRPLFPVFAFLAPAIGIATVYCRLHYAADAVAGLVLGWLLAALGSRLLDAIGFPQGAPWRSSRAGARNATPEPSSSPDDGLAPAGAESSPG